MVGRLAVDPLPVDPPASDPLPVDSLLADLLLGDLLLGDPLSGDPLLVDRGAAVASAESVRWRPVPTRPAADVLGFPAAEAFRRPVPSGRGAAVGVVSGGGVAEVSTDVKRAEWHRGDEQGRSRRPVCASSATTRVRTPDEPGAATAVPGAAAVMTAWPPARSAAASGLHGEGSPGDMGHTMGILKLITYLA